MPAARRRCSDARSRHKDQRNQKTTKCTAVANNTTIHDHSDGCIIADDVIVHEKYCERYHYIHDHYCA